jgi:hypothetical protein
MTGAADDNAQRMEKGRRKFMLGAGLVMFGMIFGGGLAMVFYFLNIRTGAMVSIGAGLIAICFGIWFQAQGAKLIRSKTP